METILQTINLSKHYGKGENLVKALDRASLEIRRGEFVAIVGKSGSGKSTLLHMLGGLDYPSSGQVLVEGADISTLPEEQLAVFRRRKIGFVFQSYNLVPSLNIWENIVLPLGLDEREPDESYLKEIIKALELENRLRDLPNTLSGGQQQRVAIGRAIASKPAIILADEPTGNLDSKTGEEVMNLLKYSARKFGQTLVVITHDEDVAQMADRIAQIEDGRVVE